MSRNLQFGGCEPIDPPSEGGQPIRSLVHELTQIGPEDYRGVIIPLYVVLDTTTLTNTKAYRVPSTHNLVIHEIIGHLGLIGLLDEVLAVNHASAGTGIGSSSTDGTVDFLGRALFKAMNAKLTLSNTDRSQDVFLNQTVNLASITPIVGGRMVDLSRMPHIIPAGETIEVGVTLQQTDDKVVGGDTEYGVVLIGHLVRVGRS